MEAFVTIFIILMLAIIAQIAHVIAIVGIGKIILMIACLVAFYKMCATKNEFVIKYRGRLMLICTLMYFKIAMLP